MSNREYLDVPLQVGMRYVVNYGNLRQSEGTTTVGIGTSAGQLASKCIVGGPFNSEEEVHEWRKKNPEHSLGAFNWHYGHGRPS